MVLVRNMCMEIEKLSPIITNLKSGKTLKRYNMPVQRNNNKYAPDINIGVTPSGTRYYRALLPDKSWGTTYLVKKDWTETVVDICKTSYGTKASTENSNEKVVISNRMIEHHTSDSAIVSNVVSKDKRVGRVARAYVPPEIYEYMFNLKKVQGYNELKPIKHNPLKKIIRNLLLKIIINHLQIQLQKFQRLPKQLRQQK